jgi:hypothetical protein
MSKKLVFLDTFFGTSPSCGHISAEGGAGNEAVLRKTIAANKAPAQFKGVGDLIPNQIHRSIHGKKTCPKNPVSWTVLEICPSGAKCVCGLGLRAGERPESSSQLGSGRGVFIIYTY